MGHFLFGILKFYGPFPALSLAETAGAAQTLSRPLAQGKELR